MKPWHSLSRLLLGASRDLYQVPRISLWTARSRGQNLRVPYKKKKPLWKPRSFKGKSATLCSTLINWFSNKSLYFSEPVYHCLCFLSSHYCCLSICRLLKDVYVRFKPAAGGELWRGTLTGCAWLILSSCRSPEVVSSCHQQKLVSKGNRAKRKKMEEEE